MSAAATDLSSSRYAILIFTLSAMLASNGCLASDAGVNPPTTVARVKLNKLLSCQQSERDAAEKDRNVALDRISKIESLLSSLTTDPKYVPTRERAEQALETARAALAKIDERLAIADLKLAMTSRAMEYLAPNQGGVAKKPSSQDAQRDAMNRQVGAEELSREIDVAFEKMYGFVDNPALIGRLTTLINRLQITSTRPETPIEVKVFAKESGKGAAASATTIYFDQAYLDQRPSESELLFVASHELAHVQLGHFAEVLIAYDAAQKDLKNEYGQEGADSLGDRTAEALIKMRIGPWEQRQEEAADILGAQQALDAGASPRGIHEAMLRMDVDEKAVAAAGLPEIQRYRDSLRDHARPLDRLKALETVLGPAFWDQADLKVGGCPK